ncbi:MAG: hypothetical protein CMI14_01645 [Oleispira sp.]|nr:hypothetical protein [Oleispira sp.]
MSLPKLKQKLSSPIKANLINLIIMVGLLPINVLAEGSGSISPVLEVSAEQQASLGLQFSSLEPLKQSFGTQWPARVTAPAESIQAFSLPVDVMVEQLYVANGKAVEKGQKIARLDSRQLRLWANELLVADEKLSQCQRELDLLTQRLELGLSKQNEVVQKQSDCLILSRRLDSAVASLRHAGWEEYRIKQLREGGVLQEYLETTASVKGVVAKMNITPGQHLEAGVTLYELWPQSQLRVQANIPDSVASQISLQSKALVSPRTEGEQFFATVERISDQVDPFNRRSVLLDITGNNVNAGAAYYVRLSQQREQKYGRSTWAVPTKAVVREAGNDWVFVQIAGSDSAAIEVHQVSVLGMIDGKLQISADLSANARIAVTATAALKGIWLGMGGE